MKSIAIIPARGGSKRIPRHHIKSLAGHPIIKSSIDDPLKSRCFDEVMVSTDDREIADISESLGAKVPFLRSAENSADMAMTAPVLIEVLDEYKKRGMNYDLVCCIYPTALFVTPDKLISAKKILIENDVDCVLPIVKFSYPIQRSLILKDGRAVMFWPENHDVRSQDLEPAYHDCGQYYFMKVKSVIEQRVLFCKNTIPIIVSDLEVQDIDNEGDWKIAEVKYKMINNLL